MRSFIEHITALAADENGTTVIEYGLIAAFISVSCITAMGSTGSTLSTSYDGIASTITTATGNPAP